MWSLKTEEAEDGVRNGIGRGGGTTSSSETSPETEALWGGDGGVLDLYIQIIKSKEKKTCRFLFFSFFFCELASVDYFRLI